MKDFLSKQIVTSIEVKQMLLNNADMINMIIEVSKKAIEAYKNRNKILIAGNGGSAADAQHIAGELVSKFYFDRPALASIALSTDTSIITAIGNDYGYEKLFSRQIEANGVGGDIFIAISTSGNSKNIIEALKVCKDKKILTVGLTGQSGGKMSELCDYCIKVPSKETPRVQESHILLGHIICSIIEEELFGKGF